MEFVQYSLWICLAVWVDGQVGFGGKNVRARILLFSSLVSASVDVPSMFIVERVGILAFPPSPAGDEM